MSDELTVSEKGALATLETTVREGLEGFVKVGNALAAIREQRLWRATSPDFESYVQATFNFTRRRANQVIESAGIVRNIAGATETPIGEPVVPGAPVALPESERVVRPLAQVPADKQAEVWKEAVETAPKDARGKAKVTSAHVEKVVAKRMNKTDGPAAGEDGPTEKDSTPLPSAPTDEPWKKYNADLAAAAEHLFDASGIIQKLSNAAGVDRAFAGWIDPKRYATFFTDAIAQLENHRVTRWSTKDETAKSSDKRNFRYAHEDGANKKRRTA
jgi:hypothetical protein